MNTVYDFMTKQVTDISGDANIAEAVKLMKAKKIGALLVKEDDKIAGVFTERDLVNRVDFNRPDGLNSMKIRDVMTRDLKMIDCEEPYINVADLMDKHNIRHMPVTRRGQIIGIVSLRDMLRRHREYLEHQIELNVVKIRESEATFRTIFNNSVVGITLADDKERVVAWNPFAARMLAMDDEDLRGKPLKDLYPREEWKRIRAEKIRKVGEKHHMETRIVNGRGQTINIDLAVNVLKDANGAVTGSIGIMRDISEHKKMEKLREEFIGVVSHELRTPLVPIREGVSQILDGLLGEITKDQREYLTMVLQEIDRLKRIINDLLDMFKFEAGKITLYKEMFDMVQLVKDTVSMFSPRIKNKNLEIKTNFSGQNIQVYADRDRVIQVFSNLISNSIKYTDKGYIEISVEDNPKGVECTILDTGRGVSKHDIPLLFNRFQQLDIKGTPREIGTGLGLAICMDIIKLHNGKIRVKSKINKGTKIIFTFPRLTSEAVFEEYIADTLNEAVRKENCFSVLSFKIQNFKGLQKDMGEEKALSIAKALDGLVKNYLHGREGKSQDKTIKGTYSILAVLPKADKRNAFIAAGKIGQKVGDYLSANNLKNDVDITWRTVTFPYDSKIIEGLLKKAGNHGK